MLWILFFYVISLRESILKQYLEPYFLLLMRRTGYSYLEVQNNAQFVGWGNVNMCMSTGTTQLKSYILFINMNAINGMDTYLKINSPDYHLFTTIFSTINFVLIVKKLRWMCQKVHAKWKICWSVYSILFCTEGLT